MSQVFVAQQVERLSSQIDELQERLTKFDEAMEAANIREFETEHFEIYRANIADELDAAKSQYADMPKPSPSWLHGY